MSAAMSELGVEVIHAYSPAAKNLIEQLFQTLQDRLLKVLRLAGASNLARPTSSPTLLPWQPGFRFRRFTRQT